MPVKGDPACAKCGGSGIIEGQTFHLFPNDPWAVWWKNADQICDCVTQVVIDGTVWNWCGCGDLTMNTDGRCNACRDIDAMTSSADDRHTDTTG